MGRGTQTEDQAGWLEPRSLLPLTADEQSWLPMAARKLRRLDGAPGRSWRTVAASRLEEIAADWERQAEGSPCGSYVIKLVETDPSLFDQVAFELVAEENPRALEQGSMTWQTLAADRLADLAVRARTAQRGSDSRRARSE
jgi:hypothetical protein